MTELACNYALLRFLPYRDGGEFINVGVVLACAETGYFDFRIENQEWARVAHFFPEIDIRLYRDGLKDLQAELERWKSSVQGLTQKAPQQHGEMLKRVFGELIRHREAMLYYSDARTVLTLEPELELDKLFERHVHRSLKPELVQS